ncbi:Flagellar biosynthetic protein FliP [Candidatus Cyrtobacter comes]|uniref:Flagellar biosynthetic protein FliP n=1 Tax=Candidatus Cyrtobacter comes TaxID=675776 RepID=A0ABU5L8Q8_9RICK|nr:flagellar type III secretion system pore protein FliP [Candidatus Cyrtobacter comes]MDZ5762495.1 Flagellar biosynthetic protein FliP [Candidatus Cyrtobacter comes]
MSRSRLFLYLFFFLFPYSIIAEPISIDLGDGNLPLSSKIMQLVAVITVLSIAPSLLIMVTSFTRIIVVMSILRTAIGLQQSPPNVVMIGLSLFLTFFIMTPTFERAYNEGIEPVINGRMDEGEALIAISKPFKDFMLDNVNEKELSVFIAMAKKDDDIKKDDVPLQVLIPAFMISELKRAFEIGFLIFLPFLIIDMVVSSILMSMGMMMLPPVMISLPFKIIFFVLVDGWYMICAGLVKSYGG